MPWWDNDISLLVSYLDLNIEVIKKAVNSRCWNGNDKRLVNIGPIALSSNFLLKTKSGKQLEDISQAHIIFLMYKLINSAKDSDDLSIGFDRDRGRRKQELTGNKNLKVNTILDFCWKMISVWQNTKKRAFCGLGCKLTLTWDKDEAVIDKVAGIADARNKFIIFTGM